MMGTKPAVALFNPKYQDNFGTIIRSCSAWKIPTLMWSGNRVKQLAEYGTGERAPRELRMADYKDVDLLKTERFKDHMAQYIPVAVEFRKDYTDIFDFEHPVNAMYIFGPEDGSLERIITQHCHKFVYIPTAHPLNLATAVNVVLATRSMFIENLKVKDNG